MSSNRLMYDTCEYQTRLNESMVHLRIIWIQSDTKTVINAEWI